MASLIIWWMCWSPQKILILSFSSRCKRSHGKIYDKGRIPILVGGTGFYIQAVTRDIDFTQAEQDDGYRADLEAIVQEKGAAYLHQMLTQVVISKAPK